MDFSRVVRTDVCVDPDVHGRACGVCEVCEVSLYGWTPRTVDVFHSAAESLGERLDLVLGGKPALVDVDLVRFLLEGELPSVVVEGLTVEWAFRFRERLAFLVNRLRAGEVPFPLCTADEMLLHMVVGEARLVMEEREGESPHVYVELEALLPHHPEDYGFEWLVSGIVEDDDVLMLFSPRMEFLAENPRSLLHPLNWFVPFAAPVVHRGVLSGV